ncbi:MAG: hypothetical protein ABIP94_23455, partial [Planctomycetota bacterium]
MTRASMLQWSVVAVLGLGLLAAMLRLAWIGDDAYITLRTVENLLAGHGLVWNVGERVQTYTHPLWMFLLVVARWLTGEHYFTTILLSVALSSLATLLLVRLARSPFAAAAVLLMLLASRAFGDFATSGLETPLVALLLVLLASLDERAVRERTGFTLAVLLLGLLGTTRLDLLALAGPVVLAHARGPSWRTVVRGLVLGLAPLWSWSAFATFYYGTPLPITAYAKATATGVPVAELVHQGWRYLLHTLTNDPATVVVVALGITVGLLVRSLGGRALALGTLLYCCYVVRVGGDFMAGRFFVPPFVAALALLARWLRAGPSWRGVALSVMALGLAVVPGVPPFLRSPSNDTAAAPAEYGIQDERRFYFGPFGLFSAARDIPIYGRYSAMLRRQGREGCIVMGSGMAGGIPFEAGDLFHFIDPWLCDPLLMRLPMLDPKVWRIGHFTRGFPAGYAESIAREGNYIEDAGLHRYYACLRTVLRAPLFAGERLAAAAELVLGTHADGLRDYVAQSYRQPARRQLASDHVPDAMRSEGTFWFDDPGVHLIGRGGLRVRCSALVEARSLQVALVPLSRYVFTFFAGEREVGRAELAALVAVGVPPKDGDLLGYLRGLLGLHYFTMDLPAGMPGFDAYHVDCVTDPWGTPAIG